MQYAHNYSWLVNVGHYTYMYIYMCTGYWELSEDIQVATLTRGTSTKNINNGYVNRESENLVH